MEFLAEGSIKRGQARCQAGMEGACKECYCHCQHVLTTNCKNQDTLGLFGSMLQLQAWTVYLLRPNFPSFFRSFIRLMFSRNLEGKPQLGLMPHTPGRQLKPFGFQVLADPRSRRSASLSLARTAACEFGEKNLCKETVQATLLRKNDVVNYDRLLFSFLWIQPGPLLMLSAVL